MIFYQNWHSIIHTSEFNRFILRHAFREEGFQSQVDHFLVGNIIKWKCGKLQSNKTKVIKTKMVKL